MSARFITFEGIDGAGKSTHLDAVAQHLRRNSATVVVTREPGGTPLAETLRDRVLGSAMDALTEVLLVFAARRDHIVQVIAPALARGDTVLCDRFTDATFAYQGGGHGISLDWLRELERWVQGDLQPLLTLWFDIDPALAAARRAAARSADRFESRELAFFERVRDGYRQRYIEAPQRIARIDAQRSTDEVAAEIRSVLEARGC